MIVCIRLLMDFVYVKLMYYLKFINTFIVLSVKLCENGNRFLTSILELIKQIINNA